MPTLRDLFPPEAQHLMGMLMLSSAGVGFLLWLAGIKIARQFVALFLGGAGALVAVWQLPPWIGIAPLTAGILGFVAGVLLGALTFKILQSLVLAVCIAVAVAGVYYYWHTTASQPTAQVALTTEAPQDADVPAQDLQVTLTEHGPPTTTPSTMSSVVIFYKKGVARWNTLPIKQQRPILIFSLSAAVLTLLLAFSYPRQTTWLTTATIGSLLLFGGLDAACRTYTPQYNGYLPGTALSRYLTLALLISVGLLLQYKLFWPTPARKQERTKIENPLHRGPENA